MTALATTEASTITASIKRAFVYLRVSSDSQVNTGYSADGLSIDAQREAAADKALQLDAETAAEFSDPGKSAYVDLHKRTGFLAMLDELKRRNEHASTRVDYVIVWALNRWARNIQDHFRTHELVRQAGARLISITEPMVGDDTPESFWMEGMMAVTNQYESMKTGRNVRGGLYQRAKAGGSYGSRRLGYISGIETLPDGRQVSAPVLDPDRHHFITHGFSSTPRASTPSRSSRTNYSASGCAACPPSATRPARLALPPGSACSATPTTPAN